MEDLIAQEEEGCRRVQAQNERKDKWIADHVQANAEEPSTSANAAASSEGGKAVQEPASASAPSASASGPSASASGQIAEHLERVAEKEDESMEPPRSTAGSDKATDEEQVDAEMEE